MNPIFIMWMQPLYARMNIDSKKTLYWMLGVFFLAGQILASLLFFWGRPQQGIEIFFYAFLLSIAAMLAIGFMAWFVMLAQYIGQQYSPANAGLLPQLKKYMQWAVALPIVIAGVIVTMVFLIAQTTFTLWPAFICVTIMMFLAISVRSPWTIVPMVLSFQLPDIFERAGYQHLDQILANYLGLPSFLVLLVATFAILGVGIRWMFSVRGDALFKMHKRSLAFQDGLNGKKANESQITLGFSMLFFKLMARNVAASQRKASVSNPALLVLCLSPRLHWTTIVSQLFAMVIAGMAALALLQIVLLRDAGDFVRGFGMGFGGIMAMMLPLMCVLVLFFTVYQTRTEQALVSLAPNLGNTSVQNKAYTRYLLKQFFILYAISVLVACLIGTFASLSEFKLALLSLFVSCLFPLSLNLTVPFATMKTVHDHPLMKLLLICVLLFVIGTGLIFVISPVVVWGYCGIVFGTTSLILWKRVRQNLQRNMFPVGRAV